MPFRLYVKRYLQPLEVVSDTQNQYFYTLLQFDTENATAFKSIFF